MHNLNTKVGVLLLTLATCTVAGAQTRPAYDLVQPKMREMINIANQAMNTGNMEKAIAYTELVLVHSEIKYSINTDDIADNQRELAKRAAKQAVAEWESALDGDVKFTLVPQSEATMRINFKTSIRSMGSEVAGYAVWQRQVYDWGNGTYTPRLNGDINLRTKTPTGRDMPEGAIIHTALHEVGHMLGLWDSPDFGDVMGPLHLKNPITKPSDNEVQALKAARIQAQQISQFCLSRKLSSGFRN